MFGGFEIVCIFCVKSSSRKSTNVNNIWKIYKVFKEQPLLANNFCNLFK